MTWTGHQQDQATSIYVLGLQRANLARLGEPMTIESVNESEFLHGRNAAVCPLGFACLSSARHVRQLSRLAGTVVPDIWGRQDRRYNSHVQLPKQCQLFAQRGNWSRTVSLPIMLLRVSF